MASIADNGLAGIQRERQFFLAMSLLLVATSLLGFGYFQYAGISSWGAPWWVHLHAASQMAWLGYYVWQNLLVVRGKVALHRRLGQAGAWFAGWLLIAAFGVSYLSVTTGTDDGTFTPAEAFAINWSNLAIFAALFTAALLNRQRSDWHKRLMLCAMIVLSLPAFGRTLIMLGWPSALNRTLFMLGYAAIGMAFDWRTRSWIHPAYLWGAGAMIVFGLLMSGLAQFGPFADFANGLAP